MHRPTWEDQTAAVLAAASIVGPKHLASTRALACMQAAA
jgi:hypothetical protein